VPGNDTRLCNCGPAAVDEVAQRQPQRRSDLRQLSGESESAGSSKDGPEHWRPERVSTPSSKPRDDWTSPRRPSTELGSRRSPEGAPRSQSVRRDPRADRSSSTHRRICRVCPACRIMSVVHTKPRERWPRSTKRKAASTPLLSMGSGKGRRRATLESRAAAGTGRRRYGAGGRCGRSPTRARPALDSVTSLYSPRSSQNCTSPHSSSPIKRPRCPHLARRAAPAY